MSEAEVERARSSTDRFLAYAREGDGDALGALLREHLDTAHAQAMRMLGHHSDAEDAIQDALLKLVRTADRYDGSVPFEAWLGRLVHTAAIDVHRSRARRRRREAVVRTLAPAPSGDDQEEQADLIRQELAGLAAAYRLPLDLHYLSGLSLEQTAVALGLNQVLVRKRIQRAKEQLVERLRRRGVTLAPALLLGLLTTPAEAATSPTVITAPLDRAALPTRSLGAGGIAISGIAALISIATFLTLGLRNADGAAQESAPSIGGASEASVDHDPQPVEAAAKMVTPEATLGDAGMAPIRVAKILHDGGFAYKLAITFAAPDTNPAPATSPLRLFEDGIELGPAHSVHSDIRTLGAGRFSHWYDQEHGSEVVIFSASDGSDPRTNGRRYTYGIPVVQKR